MMNWASWLIIVPAFIEGEQLGPWSKLVSKVGIQPISTLMKTIHVVIGISWLIATICFILQYNWAWWGLLTCAVAAVRYLPFGTLLSDVRIAMLVFVRKQIQPTGS